MCLWMTASFVDVMVIDSDTFAFLWQVFPNVRTAMIVAAVAAIPALCPAAWRLDLVSRRAALRWRAVQCAWQ